MNNPKNELLEFLQDLGYAPSNLKFKYHGVESGNHVATATLQLKEVLKVEQTGYSSSDKKSAEMNACASILQTLQEQHGDLIIDWETVFIEAQAGDALVKLCSYLLNDLSTAAEKSYWLQRVETDQKFAKIFDRLYTAKDPAVAFFGKNIGAKRKATWIEALIWREYKDDILHPTAEKGFDRIYTFLTRDD